MEIIALIFVALVVFLPIIFLAFQANKQNKKG